MLWSYLTFRSSWTGGRWPSSAAWRWWMRELETETASTSASLESGEVQSFLQHAHQFSERKSLSLLVVLLLLLSISPNSSGLCASHFVILPLLLPAVLTVVFSLCISLKVIWVPDTSSRRSESARCGSPQLVGNRIAGQLLFFFYMQRSCNHQVSWTKVQE